MPVVLERLVQHVETYGEVGGSEVGGSEVGKHVVRSPFTIQGS